MVQLSELASALKQTESKGVFSKHPKGFGFVHPEGETDKTNDIYIGQNETKFAMDGDKVTVKVLYPKTEKRGQADKLLKSMNEQSLIQLELTVLYLIAKPKLWDIKVESNSLMTVFQILFT